MSMEQIQKQHQEGLAKLGVLYSQKESIESQIKNLKEQLLQLEAIQSYAASSQPEPTATSEAPGEGE